MQSNSELKAIKALSNRQGTALNRKRVVVDAIQGTSIIIEGSKFLSFASNDYLGLAQHPEVKKAYQTAANLYGVGSVSSPLLSGYTKAHQSLEEELADFSGFPKTLLFSSGYMANLAMITSFVTKEDHVFSDRHNHASLVDALRLSSATLFRYPHLDVTYLRKKLAILSNSSMRDSSRWIVTEGVYSVDGDIAPLLALKELAEVNNSRIIVDDAHGFGVLGKEGKGTLAHYGLTPQAVSLVTGSFSKAFGCFGAFVAATEEMIEVMIQFARPYIYSTAIPATVVESLRVILRLMMEEEWRREKLSALILQFQVGAMQLGIPVLSSLTPIQIVLVGNSEQTLLISHFLKTKGILVAALRPPTVAFGQDRLRITLSALHTEEDVDYLLLMLNEAEKQGFL